MEELEPEIFRSCTTEFEKGLKAGAAAKKTARWLETGVDFWSIYLVLAWLSLLRELGQLCPPFFLSPLLDDRPHLADPS